MRPAARRAALPTSALADLFKATYPRICGPADVIAAEREMQEMNWYTSDVYVRGHYPAFAQRMRDAYGVELDCQEGDAELL